MDMKRARGRFYDSAAWKRVRSAVIARDRYACKRCGSFFARLQVHHVRPLAFGKDGAPKEGAYDMDNCETLCQRCHMVLHGNKRPPPPRELSPSREAWRVAVQKRAAEYSLTSPEGL